MIYSIGHSTLEIPKFLELTKEIEIILDIRSHPTSHWPQYRQEEMQRWLPENGKKYEWEPGLGGWDKRHAPLLEEMNQYDVDLTSYLKGKFPKQTIAKKIQNYPLFENLKPTWTNRGLYDYSFFMKTEEFKESLKKLIQRKENIGILCCEALPWRCHRSMVADALLHFGIDVTHLQPKRTMHSCVIGNRLSRYDSRIIESW
jgi:uncharacterized protein (DUF488 family)